MQPERPQPQGQSQQPQKPAQRFSFGWRGWSLRQKLLVVAIVAFLVIALIAAVLFFVGRTSFDPERVAMDIAMPEDLVSGNEITFTLTIRNNNSVALEDADLIFTFPDGAVQRDAQGMDQAIDPVRTSIGRIASGATVEQTFSARLLGDPTATQFAEAVLRYSPSSISARFESRTSTAVRIERVPIAVEIDAPQKAIGGEEITYTLRYEVKEAVPFRDARFSVHYPDGFHFEGADPDPLAGMEDQWIVEDVMEGDEGEIRITGTLDGTTGQVKRIRVLVGEWRDGQLVQYVQSTKETLIDKHPLGLTIDVDGTAAGSTDIGSTLSYAIRFRNETNVALRELILRAQLGGDVIDMRNIDAPKGAIQSSTQTVTWTASRVPELALLAPGEEGFVTLRVPLDQSFPIQSFQDKNFTVDVNVELETLSVPESFQLGRLVRRATSQVPVNTQLTVQSLAFYNETSSAITNSGPQPPRVNETTTYTVHWRLINTANNLSDVVVRSSLPANVDWTGRTATAFSQTTLRFNDRTREIVWDVGDVPATTGVALPTYEAVFQVALTPSLQQEGSAPDIIAETVAEGVDQFTGAFREASDRAVSTLLPDDPTASGGRVQ